MIEFLNVIDIAYNHSTIIRTGHIVPERKGEVGMTAAYVLSVVKIPSGHEILVTAGYARCHEKDQFNKETGTQLAMDRLTMLMQRKPQIHALQELLPSYMDVQVDSHQDAGLVIRSKRYDLHRYILTRCTLAAESESLIAELHRNSERQVVADQILHGDLR